MDSLQEAVAYLKELMEEWLPKDAATRTLLVTSSTFLVALWLMRKRRGRNGPPGPTSLPIVGNLLSLIGSKNAHLVLYKWKKQYGDIFSLKMGSYDAVMLGNHNLIKEAFVEKADIFSNRPDYMYVSRLVSNNKGIVWDDHWRETRRFSLTALKDFGVGKTTLEERVQEEVEKLFEAMNLVEGQIVEIQPFLTKGFANVICSVVFGKRFEYDDASFVKIVAVIDELFRKGGFATNFLDFIPFLRYVPGFNYGFKNAMKRMDFINEYIYDAIEDHRSTYDPNNIRDFIDLYIQTEQQDQSHEYLSRFTLVRIVLELFLAGTDTSSTTMTWALLLMIAHPEVQRKCRQELKKVVGSRIPNSKDRTKLPYVDATLLEIQRYSNIASVTIAHVASEDTKIGGYAVHKGTMVTAFIYGAHHDSEVWPDHEEFKPERWLNEEGKVAPDNLPFVPFSLGRRQCLGLQLAKTEMFLFFTNLIQRYEFVRVDPNTPPSLETQMGITIFPVDGRIRYHRI